MDVTSLLNANSLAVEQQRKEKKKDGEGTRVEAATEAPTQNRTPWDAGGYSLPIHTISNSSSTSTQQDELHRRDSHSTPTSPHHNLSESRSSFSSFTSSFQSASHSRFSSLSTVGSAFPSGSFTEALAAASGPKPHVFDFGILSTPDVTQPTMGYSQGGSISPTGSLNALALVAENEMAGQQAQQIAEAAKASSTDANQTILRKGGDRPCSPSDAILIKRSAVPNLRLSTGDQDFYGLGLNGLNLMDQEQQPYRQFLDAPLGTHHQALIQAKSHKRALSAPAFPASVNGFTTGFTMSEPQSMGPRAEQTPPSSQHPDRTSPTSIPIYRTPDTPPSNTHGEIFPTQTILCMYIPNCDTGSQLRKAISHIFGRNKMCTRLIPAEVWVHYCRKHYQRSRYRNPKEYAKLQCDLVQQQIRRVHEWSVENANRGLPGVVKDWGLAVRKREQKRLDELNGAKKRNAHSAFEDGLNSDEDDGSNRTSSHILPATAVPDWLLQECGKGYSTHKILEIFNRLHTEILADTMPCFPDIEILPNIAVDGDEPKSPKGYTKRASPAKGHYRSQSLGGPTAAMKPNPYTQDRRMSQPAIWSQGGYSPQAPKKRRPNVIGETDSPDSAFSPYARSRPLERPLQAGRVTQLPHRPMFPDINENSEEERYNYGSSYPLSGAPLPAPTPQRAGGQSMAAHLEMGTSPSTSRRPLHQRSQSDMSAFTQNNHGYSESPLMSTGYMDPSHYGHSQFQGFAAHRSDIREESRFHEMQAQQQFSHGPTMHGRHQSIAGIPSSAMYSQLPSAYHPQAIHYQHGPAPRNRIIETQQAHSLFTDRR